MGCGGVDFGGEDSVACDGGGEGKIVVESVVVVVVMMTEATAAAEEVVRCLNLPVSRGCRR